MAKEKLALGSEWEVSDWTHAAWPLRAASARAEEGFWTGPKKDHKVSTHSTCPYQAARIKGQCLCFAGSYAAVMASGAKSWTNSTNPRSAATHKALLHSRKSGSQKGIKNLRLSVW